MWQSRAPAGAAQTPVLSPWPQPWHRIHLAPASPRPNIPLRSGPACSPPLQFQVSVCLFLALGNWLCPSTFCPGPCTSRKGAPSPALSLQWCPLISVQERCLFGRWCAEGDWVGMTEVSMSEMLSSVTRSGCGCGCSKRCVCTRVCMCIC